MTSRRLLLSGAVAGAASAFAFTALHHLLITAPTATGWWLYNGIWVTLLVLLGLASFLVFEPVTTMAAVIVALHGINVSALGLVELDGSAPLLLAEMVGLIMALIFGFAAIFLVLERRRFAPSAGVDAVIPEAATEPASSG